MDVTNKLNYAINFQIFSDRKAIANHTSIMRQQDRLYNIRPTIFINNRFAMIEKSIHLIIGILK